MLLQELCMKQLQSDSSTVNKTLASRMGSSDEDVRVWNLA